MADFIPTTRDTFHTWQGNLFDRLMEKVGSFKLEAADMKDLEAAKSKYELAHKRASNPESANRADRVELRERTATYKAMIRQFNNSCLRFNSYVSDYDRQYLGLTVVDTNPTPAAVPVSQPALSIDFSAPLHHSILIKDNKLNSKRKPAGVKECEIWYTIAVDEPLLESDMQYAGVCGKSTFGMDFNLADRGKKVWYRARWINTRGQHGTWGVYASAIIA